MFGKYEYILLKINNNNNNNRNNNDKIIWQVCRKEFRITKYTPG